MKRIFVAFTFFMSQALQAQQMRCALYTGYVTEFPEDAYVSNENYFNATIEGGIKYGIDLENRFDPAFSAGISYQYQNTTVPVSAHLNGVDQSSTYRSQLNWILLGGTCYLERKRFELLLGAQAGICHLHLYDRSSQTSSRWRFAWSARAGANFFFSRTFGLTARFEGLFSSGSNKALASSNPASNISSCNLLFQFNCTSGLIIRLGKIK